ncbi:AMP-dependent synthetase/ligase [Pseudomonadota bacterium]
MFGTTGSKSDFITPEVARILPGLFCERLKRSPNAVAFRHFDKTFHGWSELTWSQMAAEISRWQQAIKTLLLQQGDRVAIMVPNCPQWVMLEQACLSRALVTVPLFVNDRPDNVAYVLKDAGVRLLLIEGKEQWKELSAVKDQLDPELVIWSLDECDDERVTNVYSLLGDTYQSQPEVSKADPNGLATIVYTSGTTGRPKGVMLSHTNILWNAYAGLRSITIYPDDSFLSFLPLSHTLERTIGYYLPMMAGASISYARSIPHLAEDLQTLRPTVMISVPRIYERTYAKIKEQLDKDDTKRKLFEMTVASGWRSFQAKQGNGGWHPQMLLRPILKKIVADKVLAKLGGRLRIAICGGAPMPEHVGKTFIGLGLNLLQGYGMTESSPVISVNTPKDNDPLSVGPPLPDVEVRIGENDELLVRSPGVMKGYWQLPEATKEAVDEEGWLHTGDKAKIDAGKVYITGRLKDIIVLANGEKVPPPDMEMAIVSNPIFEQVIVIGDGRPFLAALVVLNREECRQRRINPDQEHAALETMLLPFLGDTLKKFPGYAQVRKLAVLDEAWTVENDMLTPTLKPKRAKILERFKEQVEHIYHGHC